MTKEEMIWDDISNQYWNEYKDSATGTYCLLIGNVMDERLNIIEVFVITKESKDSTRSLTLYSSLEEAHAAWYEIPFSDLRIPKTIGYATIIMRANELLGRFNRNTGLYDDIR